MEKIRMSTMILVGISLLGLLLSNFASAAIIPCSKCHGTGKIQKFCNTCGNDTAGWATGYVNGKPCPTCGGKGTWYVTCDVCGGSGEDMPCLAGLIIGIIVAIGLIVTLGRGRPLGARQRDAALSRYGSMAEFKKRRGMR